MQAKIITNNKWRLKKFQTKTILTNENGRQIVYRCPITEAARPFINTIIDREKASQEYLKGHFDVLRGVQQNGCLRYDYLPYPSLLQIIETQFRQNHPSKANQSIEAYVTKVKALQSIYVIPENFYQIIGLSNENDNTKLSCLCRGLLDLIPQNILVDGDRWIVIDNEWSFDFPIPIVFILFRTIISLSLSLQLYIRMAADETFPVVKMFASRIRNFYVPQKWANYIADRSISIQQMFRWELGFQQYVCGRNYCSHIRTISGSDIRTHFSRWILYLYKYGLIHQSII